MKSRPSIRPLLGRIRAYSVRYWRLYAVGAVLLVATNYLGLEIPRQLGNAVQLLRDAKGIEQLVTQRSALTDIAVTVILLALGAGVCRTLSRIAIFYAGRFIEYDIRSDLYHRLSRLTPTYFGTMPTGDLTSRVTNDVSQVRVLFAIPFLHVINASLAFPIALQKMVGVSLDLTLWCLAPYPVLLLVVWRLIRAMFEQTKLVQATLASLSARVQENLSGIAVVKTYAVEDLERDRFAVSNSELLRVSVKLAIIRDAMFIVMGLIASSGTLMALILGAPRVVSGELSLGEFIELNAYLVALAFPTLSLGWALSVWHRGTAALERVAEVLDAEPDLSEAPDAKSVPELAEKSGAIVFENVSFSYDDGTPVLRDLSFEIKAGSTVAIVGRTGAGKSTLVRLISRLYDPDEGRISIDGVPLTELRLRETRSEIGAVPQEPFLFSMTIGNNVRFGLDSLEHDDTLRRALPTAALMGEGDDVPQSERVAQALDVAGVRDEIESFPQGMQTLVGERGITLSGGQKQRITIARALLVDPRILVLDDALSSVDTQTEARILDDLEEIMRGRTSVIVTHRFNALSRVDEILVLDEGRLVEHGTHDELRQAGGIYADLYEKQRLREELEL